jgi:hypothetical protein
VSEWSEIVTLMPIQQLSGSWPVSREGPFSVWRSGAMLVSENVVGIEYCTGIRNGGASGLTRKSEGTAGAALLIVGHQLRRRVVQFKPVAHFLHSCS